MIIIIFAVCLITPSLVFKVSSKQSITERIREISGYITEGGIDSVSFYESVPILETNYWNKYKHYFVNSMDGNSFTAINQFYSYALEIQEQQMFAKELQKKKSFISTTSYK